MLSRLAATCLNHKSQVVSLEDFLTMKLSLPFQLQQQHQQHRTDKPLAAWHEETRCRMTHLTVKSLHRLPSFLPTPSFPLHLLAVELPPPRDEFWSPKGMVDPNRGSIGDLQFDKFPSPNTFSYWITNFKTDVCSNSTNEAMPWIKVIELATSVDDLKRSQSLMRIATSVDSKLLF